MEQQGNTDYSSLEFSSDESFAGVRLESVEVLGINYLNLDTSIDRIVNEKEIKATLSRFPIAEILPFIAPLYTISVIGNNEYDSTKKVFTIAIKSWQKGRTDELVFWDKQIDLAGKTN